MEIINTKTRSDAPQNNIKPTLAHWQRAKVLAFIDSALEDRIYITELARVAMLSRSQFSRAFKGSFDQSPMQYIMRRRVERSKQEMTITNSCLSEVALVCGFADQSHFNRVFQRVVGETPKRWRTRTSQREMVALCDRRLSALKEQLGEELLENRNAIAKLEIWRSSNLR
jgi:AraC-like DNA-binding protein